jgi:hypothetical protein
MDHAHVRLKDGRDLEFPLLIGWQAQADQRGVSTREFVIQEARTWFWGIADSQFEDDEVVKVTVAR